MRSSPFANFPSPSDELPPNLYYDGWLEVQENVSLQQPKRDMCVCAKEHSPHHISWNCTKFRKRKSTVHRQWPDQFLGLHALLPTIHERSSVHLGEHLLADNFFFTDTGWLDTTMVCCQVWSVNTFQSLYKYGLFGSGKLGQLLCAIPARRSRWERRRARYKGLYDRGGNTLLERSSSRFHMRFHWLRFSDALLRSIFWLLFVYHSTAAQSILCG